MEYTLALDRSKSRTSSLTALKKVEQMVQNEQRIHSFLHSDILTCPEEINYGLFLRREASNTSISRAAEEPHAELHVPRPRLVAIIERYPCESITVIPAEPPTPHPRAQGAALAADDGELFVFGRVIALLKRIFKIERVEESDFELQDYERDVLATIIRRKYGESLRVQGAEPRVAAQIAAIVQRPSKKRPEEKYKFVFKRAFKLLKEQFAQETKAAAKLKGDTTERAFYDFYFSEYAARHRLPLEKYYNPKNSTAKNCNYHKTISIDYVGLIRESPLFVRNFMAALEQIGADCDSFIDAKLRSLGLRFVEFYTKRPDAHMQDICHYIAKNAKCKLPWTKREVGEALEIVTKLFA